jgi:hypothetical protein
MIRQNLLRSCESGHSGLLGVQLQHIGIHEGFRPRTVRKLIVTAHAASR